MQQERTEDDPIVIGGGPCTYNPEPLADFFDLFYIGEGETSTTRFLIFTRNDNGEKSPREDFSMEACKIPGIYVPSLYECDL